MVIVLQRNHINTDIAITEEPNLSGQSGEACEGTFGQKSDGQE